MMMMVLLELGVSIFRGLLMGVLVMMMVLLLLLTIRIVVIHIQSCRWDVAVHAQRIADEIRAEVECHFVDGIHWRISVGLNGRMCQINSTHGYGNVLWFLFFLFLLT